MTDRYENLQALYQAARPNEEPRRADLRAVRAAMMSAGIAAVTFHASSAAGKLLALAPGGAKLFTLGQVVTYTAIGVAVGGGIATVGVVARHNAATHAAVAAASPKPPLPVKGITSVASPSEPMQPEPSERADLPAAPDALSTAIPSRSNQESRSAPIATAEPLETSAPPVPPAPEHAGAPPALSLLDESRGLAVVQVALGSGNVSRALQLLDQQDQAFRGGSLAQERAAARVIALCTSHRADAELAKERFMNAYPGSPLVRRVTAACKAR